ncbi:MAG: 5'/3'-nucleotidase SurE [Proteobacteria bacterium]|nr:5'/3'-nucleotidase SurE [Pseudomonadota bacterium]
MRNPPLILVTNDDGVNAPGLLALADEMRKISRTVIIAPDRDSSAASHSLTMQRPLRVRELEADIYSIDGTPTDCIIIGTGKVLAEKPALVVSGINPGPNLGDDISYSGTVSAAIEATMVGIPSFAVSQAGDAPFDYAFAAALAGRIARNILNLGLPPDTLLNVNVPENPVAGTTGIAFTRQGRRSYDGAIQEISDPWGRPYYWIGGGTPSWDDGESTDTGTVQAGHVSITPLHLDRTNYGARDYLAGGWADALTIGEKP